MNSSTMLVLTLAVGLGGGLLAHRLKLPGGAIFGALFAVAALRLTFVGLPEVPHGLRIAAQILIGVVIGASLSRQPLAALRRVSWRVLPLVLLLLATGIGCAYAFAWVTDLPLLTTLFSTAPGGASDMTAAALEFDTDAALIAGFHLIRQVAIFVVIAWLFERYLRSDALDS